VTRADFAKLHHRLRATPRQTNLVIAVLSKMMSLAEGWGLRPDGSNPCRRVEKFREVRRERFLTADEMGRLGAALADTERDGTVSVFAAAAIRLLALTGARVSEILTPLGYRGSQVRHRTPRRVQDRTQDDLPACRPRPLTSCGHRDESKTISMSSSAGAHLTYVKGPRTMLRPAAKLDGVRLHDLRHSFASVGGAHGLSLAIVGKLLGHATPTMNCAVRVSERIGARKPVDGRREKRGVGGRSRLPGEREPAPRNLPATPACPP
jgi:integrase